MFLPWDADGETHPAWGTAGLAAANLAVAILAGCVEPFFGIFEGVLGGADSLILRYDEFKPWTWITSAFLRANLAHLAINMLFLLTFGRIVEARAGTGRFLLLSVALIATQGLMENAAYRELREAPDHPSTHLSPTAADHVRSYVHNLLLLAGGVLVAEGLVLLFTGSWTSHALKPKAPQRGR